RDQLSRAIESLGTSEVKNNLEFWGLSLVKVLRRLGKNAIGSRRRAGFHCFVHCAHEVMVDFLFAEVAPRNRKTNSIAPLRPALSSADDGTSPPLGRAEALAIRQVAGLVEVRSAQVMNTSGRDSQREIKIRQHLERAR